MTFGIAPYEPQTGYGDIEAGDPLGEAYSVASFQEKPDPGERRLNIITRAGTIGIAACSCSRSVAIYKIKDPDYNCCACEKSVATVSADLDFIRIDCDAFTECPDDSIDCGHGRDWQTR